ncbi:MAG: DUF1571 domain-containing protein [Planctomycetia bacterium]|nr:DUF1571 domain-containing protein [Planctomycetia bacterium]
MTLFFKKKNTTPHFTRQGSYFLVLTVYGICTLVILYSFRLIIHHLPKKPLSLERDFSALSHEPFYPAGWEFLNPESKSHVPFGRILPQDNSSVKNTPSSPQVPEKKELISEKNSFLDSASSNKTFAEESELQNNVHHPYVVAKIPSETDLENIKPPQNHPRLSPSPLLRIYEQVPSSGNSGSNVPRKHYKPTQEFLPVPELPAHAEVNAEPQNLSPKNKNTHHSDHEEILRVFDEIQAQNKASREKTENPNESIPPSSVFSAQADESSPIYIQDGQQLLQKFHQHAKNRLAQMEEELHDYYCILYKWDQTNLITREREVMHLFVREKPFSVYAKYEFPTKFRNREFIFWEGHYEHSIIVSTGDMFNNRTLLIGQDSPALKNSSTHGVTEVGFQKLMKQLIQISSNAEALKDAKVRFYPDARVGNRSCYALEVTFPQKRPDLDFFRMEVMVDREYDLPIRVAMYDWGNHPDQPGEVLEEYIYIIKQLNPGLTDIDFCYLNSHYQFRDFVPRMSQREQKFHQSVLENYIKKK